MKRFILKSSGVSNSELPTFSNLERSEKAQSTSRVMEFVVFPRHPQADLGVPQRSLAQGGTQPVRHRTVSHYKSLC